MTVVKDDRKRGAEVARKLGWPRDEIGFWGAAGSLANLGCEYRRLAPTSVLITRYRAETQRELQRWVIDWVKRFS